MEEKRVQMIQKTEKKKVQIIQNIKEKAVQIIQSFHPGGSVSELEWTESVEVTLLTTVELQRQLNFCCCSYRANVASLTLKHSGQKSELPLTFD